MRLIKTHPQESVDEWPMFRGPQEGEVMKLPARLALGALLVLPPPISTQSGDSTDDAALQRATVAIRPEGIQAHMDFLADSLLEGRQPGTRGYDVAARYVASQLEALGLRPAGPDGDWYQAVPLRKSVLIAGKSSVTFLQNGREQQLEEGVDYITPGDIVREDTGVEGDVVFVGYGVSAPELHYDDYAGVDVHGKIVAYTSNGPPKFAPAERAYYADHVVKDRNAVAHGAIGRIMFLTPDDEQRNPWAWVVPQVRTGALSWLDASGEPHDSFPELKGLCIISRHGAEMLFAGAPKPLTEVFAAAAASEPGALALPVKARIHEVSHHTSLTSPNIVAMLPGRDPALREQYVVYSAHVDHLGFCPPVAGDNVCHGAWDNASGVASVLEIARAYKALATPPRRSVLFLFVTGEEKGLLGSDYFVHFPTVRGEAIVANVNVDSPPGLHFPMKDVVPIGIEHSSLAREVKQAADDMGIEISPDPFPEETIFIRSDQYSFVKQGVPAVFIIDGVKSADPAINGLDVTKRWLVTLYHTPGDSMKQAFDFESGARAARLNFLVGYRLAQEDGTPTWNEGDFFGTKFGAAHAASVARRK
jgi:hypothetical protein